jgi:hypothetical protein
MNAPVVGRIPKKGFQQVYHFKKPSITEQPTAEGSFLKGGLCRNFAPTTLQALGIYFSGRDKNAF